MAITSHVAPFPSGFKPEWRDMLESRVAIYRRLPFDLTAELESLIPWFIDKVKWSWHAGIDREEMHKVTVACEACVLILRRSKKDYSKFREIEFFPRNLKSIGKEDWAGSANQSRVRLGWYWAEYGMEDGCDNYNVAIHEFAHIIDQKHGRCDAIPEFKDRSLKREWEKFAEHEFADLCKRWERKSGTRVIRKYGTKNIREFFACGTEAFFERSEELKLCRPKLYEWFEKIYGLDPAAWPARVTEGDLHTARRLAKAVVEDHERIQREVDERRERLREKREKARLEAMARADRERAERKREEDRKAREERERRNRLRWLTLNRTVTVFHPSGIPHLKYTLASGKRDGLMQRWDEQGNLREKTHYMQDVKDGPNVYLYPSGKKELEGYFSMNRRDGVWRGWHEDGTLKYKSEYREGKLSGWKYFLESGETKTFSSGINQSEPW